MTEKKDKNQLPDLLLVVVPALLLPALGESLDFNIPEMVLRMVLTVMGVALGGGLYLILQGRPAWLKIGSLLLMTILVFGLIIGLKPAPQEEVLLTCEVCGYQALYEPADICGVCYVELNHATMEEEGYTSRAEMVREEQLLFFATEEGVSFFEPQTYRDEEEVFHKDPDWKPLVSAEEVQAYREE
ncbi:hypothetical protein [Flavilitoribacter nigricans]|uniref:Uncharacterized protein n=1 Tax=Flavilitoribacter nigricans (strain ATCC 23147 / DSM 23189 / NBRC 102662 / NCIMB 1420 / SS-2) TaxID=1122177 RepID=A0A2D0NA88_FLAN2|nr:hypothetical protein [Flavilitoribacter nigricans]PHN05431.1 hypothetical protein CRP01_15655 [Flavilitoribacter nigricans DSM 23189 = NBRC 102662]